MKPWVPSELAPPVRPSVPAIRVPSWIVTPPVKVLAVLLKFNTPAPSLRKPFPLAPSEMAPLNLALPLATVTPRMAPGASPSETVPLNWMFAEPIRVKSPFQTEALVISLVFAVVAAERVPPLRVRVPVPSALGVVWTFNSPSLRVTPPEKVLPLLPRYHVPAPFLTMERPPSASPSEISPVIRLVLVAVEPRAEPPRVSVIPCVVAPPETAPVKFR